MFLALLVYFLLASTYFVNQFVLKTFSPLLLTGFTGLASGTILIFFFYKQVRSLKIYKEIIIYLLITAFCTSTGAPFLRFFAAKSLEPFEMSLLISLDPLITLFLAYYFKYTKINWRQSLGIALTFFSSLFLVAMQSGSLLADHFYLYIVLIGSIIINRSGWFAISRYTQHPSMNIVVLSSFLSLIGGGTSMVTSLAIERFSLSITVTSIAAVIYLMVVNNIICSISYLHFIKQYGIVFLSLLELMIPLFVTAIAVIFFEKPLSTYFVLSLLGALSGIMIFFKNIPSSKSAI